MVSGSYDRTLKLWDLSRGFCTRTMFCQSRWEEREEGEREEEKEREEREGEGEGKRREEKREEREKSWKN